MTKFVIMQYNVLDTDTGVVSPRFSVYRKIRIDNLFSTRILNEVCRSGFRSISEAESWILQKVELMKSPVIVKEIEC